MTAYISPAGLVLQESVPVFEAFILRVSLVPKSVNLIPQAILVVDTVYEKGAPQPPFAPVTPLSSKLKLLSHIM